MCSPTQLKSHPCGSSLAHVETERGASRTLGTHSTAELQACLPVSQTFQLGYRDEKLSKSWELEIRQRREMVGLRFLIYYLFVFVSVWVSAGRAHQVPRTGIPDCAHLTWVIECEPESLQPWKW